MIHRRQILKGLATTIAAVGASKFATAAPMDRLVGQDGRYVGVRYQSWTPLAPNNHITFIQRFESRHATDFKVVGASLNGGPICFVSDAEAQSHINAIHTAHLVECERVRAYHAEGAEKTIATHRKMGLVHNADLIRSHHKLTAERQVATYKQAVRDLIKDRSNMIGPSHPKFALELHKGVMADLIGA